MNSAPVRVAVLASGRGSNLRALIRAQETEEMNTAIIGVFSDRPSCAAIKLAGDCGIPTLALKPADFDSRDAFDKEMFDEIGAVQPDLIVCAGYMRLISESAVQRFAGRMINIHPSLLPKYPGLDTHARALAAGDQEHGASVHRVIAAVDAGAVIAQVRVPVLADDDRDSLAQRVLEREHSLLVQCVKAIANGTIALGADHIDWRGQRLHSPLALNQHDQLEART